MKAMSFISLVFLFSATIFSQELPSSILQIEEIEIKGTAREPLVINIAATAKIDFSNFIISQSFSREILDQVFLARTELGMLGRHRVSRPYSKTFLLLGGAGTAAGVYLLSSKEQSSTYFLIAGGTFLITSGIFYLSGR
ncbi:hypothetical protein JXA84_06870 [candidate division WOR-3 bacterium]|nr:hypothetical protein [candidate division WOR-3 bacterium]